MLEFAIETARRAGSLLLAGLEQRPAIELKSAYEVVTEIDRASERLIVEALTGRFPDHAILAEEGGGVMRDSDYIWIVDPLDGTNNFAHGFPFFAVSIALLHHNELYAGVVYDPLRDELFSALQGAGAWRNGRPMRVSATQQLAAALLSTGFPYDYATAERNNANHFDRLQACTQGIRRAGAASLDLAYVAAGRLDAHWEIGLKPWDSAAAALMVAEAGGRLTDARGADWHPWSPDLIASNGTIHDQIAAILVAP
jgi:myo-inositol-1(or 4)-monophosphatase